MTLPPVGGAGLPDHLYVVAFVVLYPLAGVLGFRRLMRRLDAGECVDRAQVYRHTLIGHWMLLGVALLLWWTAGRGWAGLGLYWSHEPAWAVFAGWAFVFAAIGILLWQLREVGRADSHAVSTMRERLGTLRAVVPGTSSELRLFYAISFTAGVVEEVLWRGYLIWYLAQYWSVGIAALVATLAFGVAHAYQGWRQVPSVMAVGAALTGLYLLTGTLWASIVLHVAIDALQGKVGYRLTRTPAARRPVLR